MTTYNPVTITGQVYGAGSGSLPVNTLIVRLPRSDKSEFAMVLMVEKYDDISSILSI
jgi:hypothetical protein